MSPAEDNSPSAVNVPLLIHDLRQPLGNIEACTSLLRIYLEEVEDERVREYLDRIDGQVEAIDRILSDVGGKPATRQSTV